MYKFQIFDDEYYFETILVLTIIYSHIYKSYLWIVILNRILRVLYIRSKKYNTKRICNPYTSVLFYSSNRKLHYNVR